MSPANEMEKRLRAWEKSWGLLTQSAVWVLGIIGGFLLPPPAGAQEGESRIWERLAQFVITISVGLVIVAGQRWKLRKHTAQWAALSAVSLIAATAMFFLYQHFADAWTCRYEEQRIVVGTEYTEIGRAYVEENPGIPCDILLRDFIGKATDIWTAESIQPRRLLLAGMYLLCLPLFTVCLLSIVQALQCMQKTKK